MKILMSLLYYHLPLISYLLPCFLLLNTHFQLLLVFFPSLSSLTSSASTSPLLHTTSTLSSSFYIKNWAIISKALGPNVVQTIERVRPCAFRGVQRLCHSLRGRAGYQSAGVRPCRATQAMPEGLPWTDRTAEEHLPTPSAYKSPKKQHTDNKCLWRETRNAYEETTSAHKETSNVHKEISNAYKETTNSHEETTNAHEENVNAWIKRQPMLTKRQPMLMKRQLMIMKRQQILMNRQQILTKRQMPMKRH